MRILSSVIALSLCAVQLVDAYGGRPVCSFQNETGSMHLAGATVRPTVVVSQNDLWGVQRAASDLTIDFGRVTGHNATLLKMNGTTLPRQTSLMAQTLIIVGTIGQSEIIDNLVSTGKINVTAVRGKWEAYQTHLVMNPAPGLDQALVIAGADKRGSIYGIYDLSQQIGVSPWYFWADVPTRQQSDVYALPGTKVSTSPSVKYRGIFLNDEAPALTFWVENNFPPGKYAPGYNHNFYELVFELLLRLRANYLWPAEWNNMFYVDDVLDGPTANDWGIVIGTSHTEPLARATKEQSLFLNGIWSWQNNQANVTNFLRDGVTRAAGWETLWTMGMRGLGDTASPTLNATQLQQIIQVEQQLLRQGLNKTSLDDVPQMWCIYKEVGGYYEDGLQVPDDITILWADDNWGNPERLPVGNETTRLAGSGVYYHFDYVGGVRDYKWINTISLPFVHDKLVQSYDRSARQIWIFNVGDLKPLEIPINFAMDLAFDIDTYHAPDSTAMWLQSWATQNYGPTFAPQIVEIMMNYSMLAARRKYELMDINIYSLINYNEFDSVVNEWTTLATAAEAVYNALPAAAKPSFFEMILHPSQAGLTLYRMYLSAAKNNLYAMQGRTSANAYLQEVMNYVAGDANLTNTYNNLLSGKWRHMMDQTHFGYNYWQAPMRNSLPSLSYVQAQLDALTLLMGVSIEGSNATLPGDDMYHSGNSLTLAPMDPLMSVPTRWMDIFSRGTQPFDFHVNISVPYVTASIPSGTLQASGSANATDIRTYLSVDWRAAPPGTSQVSIQVTTTTGGDFPFGQKSQYGSQYSVPVFSLTLRNTMSQLPSDFKGYVASNGIVSMEPEHFSRNVSGSSGAYYALIPSYSRSLNHSGAILLPYTAAVQDPTSAASTHLEYDFYTFTNTSSMNITVTVAPGLNTDPQNQVAYAIAVDSETTPQVVHPVPITVLGTYGNQWNQMVSAFATTNTTTHTMLAGGGQGKHTLKLWALTPGLTFQKIVVDLGGGTGVGGTTGSAVAASYLGPPESVRV